MRALPRARFASSPLVVLAISISAGIFTGHYFALHSNAVLTVDIVVCIRFTITTIVFAAQNNLIIASILLITAFFCAGVALSLIELRSVAPDRISRLYDEGIISPGDPVELTGLVQGQPESAPDGFYLTLRAEKIRVKGGERPATGTVLLLSHTREQQVKSEYDTLELRYGARL